MDIPRANTVDFLGTGAPRFWFSLLPVSFSRRRLVMMPGLADMEMVWLWVERFSVDH